MAGTPSYQRKLCGEVRDLTLKELKVILLDKKCDNCDQNFRQQVILRLAGSVLPRLQEISGEEGHPIKSVLIKLSMRNDPSR